MATLNDNKLAWAAGFFDGEGCIQISRFKSPSYTFGYAHRLHISISQKELKPLSDFKKMFGGSITQHGSTKAYVWQVTNLKAESFLELIESYLVCKKEESRVGRTFIKLLKGNNEKITISNFRKRDSIYNKLQNIRKNKYGR